jgi:Sulfotransferase family
MPNLNNIEFPILFIGPGRSGSSWINDIFNQHPNCKNVIENDVTDTINNMFHKSWWCNQSHNVCDPAIWTRRSIQITRRVIADTFASPEPYWCMKAIWKGHPWPFYHSVYPAARFIHLVRDPVSNIKSMMQRIGPENPKWLSLKFSEDAWLEAHKDAVSIAESGKPYYRVHYHRIASEPETLTEELFEFCQLRKDVKINAKIRINESPKERDEKIEDAVREVTWENLSEASREMANKLGIPSVQ